MTTETPNQDENLSAQVAQSPVPAVTGPQTAARLSFRQQVDHWLLGLARASVQGGAVATKAFFAAAGASVLGIGASAMDIKTASGVFLLGSAYHFIDYLSKNPIPDSANQ